MTTESNYEKRRKEEERIRGLLQDAGEKLKEVVASDIWSYTREFELGKLDLALTIVRDVVNTLAPLQM